MNEKKTAQQQGGGDRLPIFHCSMETVEAVIARGRRRVAEAAAQNKQLPGYKRCAQCGRMLRLSEANFHRRTTADGFNSICKFCDVRYVQMRLHTDSKFNQERE